MRVLITSGAGLIGGRFVWRILTECDYKVKSKELAL